MVERPYGTLCCVGQFKRVPMLHAFIEPTSGSYLFISLLKESLPVVVGNDLLVGSISCKARGFRSILINYFV